MSRVKEQLENIEWDLHEQPQEEQKPIELSGEIAPDLFGIEPIKAQEMVSGLSIVFAEREVLKNAYIDVIELPINTENLPTFKELRLKIVKNRTQGIEKWHKTNKAFYLAGGRFVDAIKNKEVLENEQMEAKLLEAEKFFDNQEKERLSLLKIEREAFLRPFVDSLPNGLEDLDQDVFDSFLETKKKAHLEKLELERLEAERIENERLDREKEIEAQRLENLRLKEEAEAKAFLRNERSKLLQPYIVFIRDYNSLIDKEENEFQKELSEIKIGAEQQWQFELDERNKKARQLFEEQEQQRKEFEKATEIRLKEEAVKQARLAKEKAEALAIAEANKLAKAPFKKQLSVWVESFELPHLRTEHETAKEIKEKFEAFKKWSITQITNL